MADTLTHNPDQIKINSGQNLQVYNNVTDGWLTLGIVGEATFNDTDTAVDVPQADGPVTVKSGATKSSMKVVINQNDSAILSRIAGLKGKKLKLYYDNGADDAGHYQEFVSMSCTMMKEFAIPLKGGAAQLVGITINFNPLSPNECTPSTDLPTAAHSHSNVTKQTSASPFWHSIDTAPA